VFAGKDGVTNPVRIPHACAKPVYPDKVRRETMGVRTRFVVPVAATLCLVCTSATAESEGLSADAEGVTNPVRISESYVRPTYPDEARIAEVEGKVTLRALVTKEGVVEKVEVVDCTSPGHGFEDAAKQATRRWRYMPALYEEEPVNVYFTIVVDFDLSSDATDDPPRRTEPIYTGRDGVTDPVLIDTTHVKPEYPPKAKKDEVACTVYLRTVVTAEGIVRDVRVLWATRPGYGFEEAAEEAVRQWRYRPARKGDERVEVYFPVTIEFAPE
jgi:TonB family protein